MKSWSSSVSEDGTGLAQLRRRGTRCTPWHRTGRLELAGLLGWLFLRFEVIGWEMWIAGAAILLLLAVILRHWARYSLTSLRVIVRNWYTGREIQAMAISDIREVTITQGPIAQFMDIGTLVLHSLSGDRLLSLRGVSDPEVIKTRIEALLPRGDSVLTQQAASL